MLMPGDRLAVAGALQVDGQKVPVLGRPGDRGQLTEVVAQPIDLRGDVLFGHLGAGDLDPQAVVARQLEVGSDLDDRVERHRAVFLPRGDVDLRGGDGVDVLVPQGAGVVIREGVLQRLLAGHVLAQSGFQHAARSLAGPESGDSHLPRDLPEGGVQCLFELVLVDLDRELDLVALEGLDDGFHTENEVYRPGRGNGGDRLPGGGGQYDDLGPAGVAPGSSAVVAHLLWEQEAGGSSPPSPTARGRDPATLRPRLAGVAQW